eukprot:TRINITY_DN1212_c0_g2_i1.p1 TRINITY_DN1212_c0_g2~~TRINITY_DN1212_c0_g2_i1.p1  ORF type:complete len:878 (+),score=280.77 TRINITY_DN1212_c0_g2_i1:686-3319(+)
MVRPLEAESELQKLDSLDESAFRPEFMEQAKTIRKKIFKKIKPKIMNGKPLNGPMLIDLCKAFINSVNGGSLPNIENAWVYVCNHESARAAEIALSMVDKRLAEFGSQLPTDLNLVKEIEKNAREEMITSFRKLAMGQEEDLKPYLEEISKKFLEKIGAFKAAVKESLTAIYLEYLEKTYEPIKDQLHNGEFKTIIDWKNATNLILHKFQAETPQSKFKVWIYKEFIEKVLTEASEFFIGREENKAHHLNLLAKQKLEMMEDETNKFRKEFEKERNDYINRVHELEREKAVLLASQQSLNEKVAHLKAEKESIEARSQEQLHELRERDENNQKSFKEELTNLKAIHEKVVSENEIRSRELEKDNALLKHELELVKKEIEQAKTLATETQGNLAMQTQENLALVRTLDTLRSQSEEKERQAQAEIAALRAKLEQTAAELKSEMELNRDLQQSRTEVGMQKTFVESQLQYMKNQYEDSKKMNEVFLANLQNGLQSQFSEQKTELLITNRNLSAAIETLENRCKDLEGKTVKLREYKRMVRNCGALQCSSCFRNIAASLFNSHFSTCSLATQKMKTSNGELTKEDPTKAPLQIFINQTMVKENGEDKPFTEYTIQVIWHDIEWTVTRKYRAFYDLHQSIATAFPGLQLPDSVFALFLSTASLKNVIASKSSTLVEERRKALQSYLRDLIRIDLVRNSQLLKTFLDFEGRMPQNSCKNKSVQENLKTELAESTIFYCNSKDNYPMSCEREGKESKEDGRKCYMESPASLIKKWHESRNKLTEINSLQYPASMSHPRRHSNEKRGFDWNRSGMQEISTGSLNAREVEAKSQERIGRERRNENSKGRLQGASLLSAEVRLAKRRSIGSNSSLSLHQNSLADAL